MSSYWVNFAKTGNPNGVSLPEWKPFISTDQQVMYLDEQSASKPLQDASRLDIFYNNLYLNN